MVRVSNEPAPEEEVFSTVETSAGGEEEISRDEAPSLQGGEAEERRQVGLRGARTQQEVKNMARDFPHP